MTITKLVMCEDLYNVLKDKIHIPDGVTELVITLRAGSPVTVTFTKFAEKPVSQEPVIPAFLRRPGNFGHE